MNAKPRLLQWSDFPAGFKVWKLNPAGVTLETRQMGDGVYALVSSKAGVNNAGFIVGEDAVLVVDALINRDLAEQIIAAVRTVTDKPIRYLVNLNYHADHTFGNCVFPADTLIVQQRITATYTPFFEEERAFMLPAVADDPTVFEGLTHRGPDIVFDTFLALDLGGRTVECHWFGPANTPGDTVVVAPEARVAWTGNINGGIFGTALESDAPSFMRMLVRMIDTLNVETLVPAHMPISPASLLGDNLQYFSDVTNGVRAAIAAGWTLDETLERVTENDRFILPPEDARAEVMHGRHLYNLRRTYLALARP